MSRLLIIGGSDAGISAGLRARQVQPDFEVKIVLADSYPNFSICGLPFYVSGETPDWRSLAHRSLKDLNSAGLKLVMETRAVEIDAAEHTVVLEQKGARQTLPYDRLIMATGAAPIRPPIPGLDLPGVHVLHTMADSFRVHEAVAAGARSAVIVGGGYIGLEMADAFRHRGLQVTLVEQLDQVMASVDGSLAASIRDELERHSVQVVTGVGVEAISESKNGLHIRGGGGFEAVAAVVLVVVGVRPAVELAKHAGLTLGIRGRFTSIGVCRPASQTYSLPVTASKPGTEYSGGPRTCLLEPPPISRVELPVRTPRGDRPNLRVPRARRLSRCSIWLSHARGCATPTREKAVSTLSRWRRKSGITRSTTRTRSGFRYG